nr:hypothetical protein [Cupriavidus sp. L7L]
MQEEWRAGQVSCARIVQPAMSRQVWICRSATMPVTLAASTVWTQLLEITAGLVDGGVWPARSVRRPGS